ncbi:hypothetical protein D3C81_1155580 [compost metagenome]
MGEGCERTTFFTGSTNAPTNKEGCGSSIRNTGGVGVGVGGGKATDGSGSASAGVTGSSLKSL